MGRRPAQSEAKLESSKSKPKKKSRRKAIPIPNPPENEVSGSRAEIIPPKKGMVFKSIEEVCEFYSRYAQNLGFATKIKSSSHKRSYIEIMCWKGRQRDKRRLGALAPRPGLYTGCPAVIKVGLSQLDGMYRLKEVVLDHNHELNPLRMHFFREGKMLSAGVKKRVSTGPDPVSETDSSFLERECVGISSSEELHRLNLAKDDVKAMNRFFLHMQTVDPNFFYLMDLDSECRVRNVFWVDGRSRHAYRYFGDIVLLDSSCIKGKYNLPLITFVGVNHHGQSILLGCGLVSDCSSVSSFIWLLRAWRSGMSCQPPKGIITDQCAALQEAVKLVFPNCPHRLCLWQIMKRIPENLEGFEEHKEIKRAFKKSVFDSLTPYEFETEWRNMVEKYGLVYNDWLAMLYQERHQWVPVFIKETFWAGMSVTRRGDNLEPFFEGYIDLNTSLKQFLDQYHTIMETKYESEALADFESFHKVPPLFTQFYTEEQLSKIYTVDVFAKFQEEIKSLVYCHPTLVKTEGSFHTFAVREWFRVKESKLMEERDYEVLFKSHGQEVRCICSLFQFSGILCRHALSVFNFQDIDEIPSIYIIDRWKRDFIGLAPAVSPHYETVANGPMERHENLYKRCLGLADLGAMSDDKYEFLLKVMNETVGKLMDESFVCKGKMVNISVVEPVGDLNGDADIVIDGMNGVDGVNCDMREGQKGKKKCKDGIAPEGSNCQKEKEQANPTNPTGVVHTMVPLTFQRTINPTSFNPWNFPPVNQIQPSNLLYYTTTTVNQPQYGILLPKDGMSGGNRTGSNSGTLLNCQQTLQQKAQKSKDTTTGPKRKRRKSSVSVQQQS